MSVRTGPRGEQRREFVRSGVGLALAGWSAAGLVRAQTPVGPSGRGLQDDADDPNTKRLPDGQMQTDAILKADYAQNVKDARELTELAKSIELDFEKNDQNVLSLALLKKLDDAEKITRRIRGRVRR